MSHIEISVHGHDVLVNNNGGKSSKLDVDWTLLPSVYDMRKVIRVFTYNCSEHGGDYPRDNWKKLDINDNFNHLLDHVLTALEIHKYDKQDAYEEITHAVCRALFVLYQLRVSEHSLGDTQ